MRSPAGTVDKAVDVLFHLHHEGRVRGVTEVSRALGLSKSGTHRLLAALGRRGLVERDEHGRYRPGVALIALGLGVLEREPVVLAAQAVLEREAEVAGETLFLASVRAGRVYVLAKAEGRGFLRAAPQVGSEVPVHATAVGKLCLAFAREELRFDPGSLEAFTSRTCNADSLDSEVDRTRKRGWGLNRDEWVAGLSVVAAPVWLRGRLVAAVALAAPTARLASATIPEAAGRVVAAAAEITGRLQGAEA